MPRFTPRAPFPSLLVCLHGFCHEPSVLKLTHKPGQGIASARGSISPSCQRLLWCWHYPARHGHNPLWFPLRGMLGSFPNPGSFPTYRTSKTNSESERVREGMSLAKDKYRLTNCSTPAFSSSASGSFPCHKLLASERGFRSGCVEMKPPGNGPQVVLGSM